MTKESFESPPRDEIIRRLFDLFRRAGYEGVSISDISEATGLGRSSLYHHFPGGKEEMAAAVVAFAKDWAGANIVAPLREDAPAAKRIDRMLAAVRELYECGEAPCIVASMLVQRNKDGPGRDAGAIIKDWIAALAAALRDAGLTAKEAEARAVAAVIDIEGALIVARAAGRAQVFEDAVNKARKDLLA